MNSSRLRVHPASLARLRSQFEHWRQTRHRRSPIPKPLWAAALAAARTHGLYRTARTLGLSYGDLKRRLGATDGVPAATSFVELLPGPGPTSPPCTLELANARGTTLRLQVPGITPPELAALSRTLWQTAR